MTIIQWQVLMAMAASSCQALPLAWAGMAQVHSGLPGNMHVLKLVPQQSVMVKRVLGARKRWHCYYLYHWRRSKLVAIDG